MTPPPSRNVAAPVSRQLRLVVPFLLCLLSFRYSLFHLSLFQSATFQYFELPTLVFRSNTTTTSTSPRDAIPSPPPRYAYTFLIAGCDPSNDGISYRGFLYSVLMAIHTLMESGSQADFIVMIQMAGHVPPTNATLRDLDVRPFLQLNQTHPRHPIYFYYLPKPPADNFYQAMMTKFILLNWTQYSRILYLDADVLPYCNLDYFFDLSERGILKPNVILAAGSSPINGGLFLVRPHADDFANLQRILEEQQRYALQWAGDRRKMFDEVQGWGHRIEPARDYWMTVKKAKGTLWNFHAAFADQGLLYHWVKYVQKNVSIIIYDIVEQWSSSSSSDSDVSILEFSIPTSNVSGLGCHGSWRLRRGVPRNPYQDFWHHMGEVKPWEMTIIPDDVTSPDETTDARQIWFHFFRKVYHELNMSNGNNRRHLNMSMMFPLGAPALGRNPNRDQMFTMAKASGITPRQNESLAVRPA